MKNVNSHIAAVSPDFHFRGVEEGCVLMIFAIFGVAVSHSPPAAAEGVLPLKTGIYVDASQSCLDPQSAYLKAYDGKGISSTGTHACELTVHSASGNSYEVSQQCVSDSAGSGNVANESMTVSIVDSGQFTISAAGVPPKSYDYCSPLTLSPGLTPPN